MRRSWIVLTCLPILACGSDEEPPSEAPTYFEHIGPILSENCSICHSPEGIQPNLLFNDADATSALSGAILNAVESGRMPPFYAEETAECDNPWGFDEDPRLSQEEIDLIADWAAAGGPTGSPEDAAIFPPPSVGVLQDPDIKIYPSGKYTTGVASTVEDEFVCFSLDPGLATQNWLEGFEVLPDDLGVVHHVLVGIDHSGSSAAIINADGTYPCFGGFGDVDATFVGGWIPGSSPIVFPERSARRMEAGSRIVLQMHYHLLDEAREDGTGIALRFSKTAPIQEALVTLHGNSETQREDGNGLQPGEDDDGNEAVFRIPANSENHLESMNYQPWNMAPRKMFTFLIANHMHYIGTDMRVWVERGDTSPTEEDACLLHTPQWDFDWQQFYKYDASSQNAPVSYPGDTLHLECQYNNSMNNPAAKKAIEEAGLSAPTDVYLGEGTLDEMCILIIGQIFDIPTTVDNESHQGEQLVDIGIPFFGETYECSGPASFSIAESGDLTGVSACGLDLGEDLITMEYAYDATVDSSGLVQGTVTVSVLYLEDKAIFDLSGQLDDNTLSVTFSGRGTFSNTEVDFAHSGEFKVSE